MPLGDSITAGLGHPGGYRLPLWSHLQSAQIGVDLVGGLTSESPEFFIDPEHEGHVGWTTADLLQFDGSETDGPSTIESLVTAADPDWVLLHIGTNDMLLYDGWHLAPQRLSQLIDRILGTAPAARVHVATIICTADPSTNLGVDWYNARVRQLCHEKWLAGAELRLVDIARVVGVEDLSDGVHPNKSGYDKIAAAWFGALESPSPGVVAPTSPPPPVVGCTATADSVLGASMPELAVNGAGLAVDLHADESDGVSRGWRSEPFEQSIGPGGVGTPLSAGPTFTVHLPHPGDVKVVEIWNGRNLSEDGQTWVNLESARRVRIRTQDSDGTWVDRGEYQLVRGMGRSQSAPERMSTDWVGVTAVRFEVLDTYGDLSTESGVVSLPVAFSEVRLLGHPSS